MKGMDMVAVEWVSTGAIGSDLPEVSFEELVVAAPGERGRVCRMDIRFAELVADIARAIQDVE